MTEWFCVMFGFALGIAMGPRYWKLFRDEWARIKAGWKTGWEEK